MPVVYGTVTGLPTVSPTDGGNLPIAQGKQGDLLVSQMHGKYYTACYRGAVFIASTLAAGIVVPFIAATVASKHSLWNPAASGKVLELIDINLLQVPGSSLITGTAIAFQGPLAQTGGVAGTLTVSTGAFSCARVGSNFPSVATLYSAATLTNVAIANLSPVIMLYNSIATTTISQGPTNYQFDGKIVMTPDTISALVDTITGTQSASPVSISWAEWPV